MCHTHHNRSTKNRSWPLRPTVNVSTPTSCERLPITNASNNNMSFLAKSLRNLSISEEQHEFLDAPSVPTASTEEDALHMPNALLQMISSPSCDAFREEHGVRCRGHECMTDEAIEEVPLRQKLACINHLHMWHCGTVPRFQPKGPPGLPWCIQILINTSDGFFSLKIRIILTLRGFQYLKGI